METIVMKLSHLPKAGLAALLMLCLAGCGPAAGPDPIDPSSPPPAPSAVQTPQPPVVLSPEPSQAGAGGSPTQPGSSQDEAAWNFDSRSGVLTFEGKGPLSAAEPESADDLPFSWVSLSGEVTSIVIGEGITRIPSFAFYGFQNVGSIALPSTLESIGTYAFFQCAFQEIALPAGLRGIGSYAFSNCQQLRSCDIPSGVKTLENGVFAECYALQNITLCEGLLELKDACFWCSDKINSLVVPASVINLEKLYAEGIRVMVFKGDPPALPQDPVTGEYWLGYGVTVYYPAGNEAWRRLATRCRDDIVWIEGVPEDGA